MKPRLSRKAWPLLAIGLLLALLLVGLATAGGGGPYLARAVIGGGGGRVQSGSVVLDATIGQAVAGYVRQDTLQLCSGFWCGQGGTRVFLPLMMGG